MNILDVKAINKTYTKQRWFKKNVHPILKNVTFSLAPGECIAIVGKSGSGKSTLANIMLGIESATSGEMIFREKTLTKSYYKQIRKEIQGVFQVGRRADSFRHADTTHSQHVAEWPAGHVAH